MQRNDAKLHSFFQIQTLDGHFLLPGPHDSEWQRLAQAATLFWGALKIGLLNEPIGSSAAQIRHLAASHSKLFKRSYFTIYIRRPSFKSCWPKGKASRAAVCPLVLWNVPSCSTPGTDRSSVPCHNTFPLSASRRFIQFLRAQCQGSTTVQYRPASRLSLSLFLHLLD